MDQTVLEFKCPCCNGGLRYAGGAETLKCEYCDNTFDLETLRACAESQEAGDAQEVSWEERERENWTGEEQECLRSFQCPSCGGEILTDSVTAATFCPYCDNPTVLPSRLSGSIRPDALIPFGTTREDAKTAFLKLCRGKPLLPREFTREQRLEHITGVYVPFWLYDCQGELDGSYRATRIHRWADSNYNYTRTEHFLLRRTAQAAFAGIPMDGSTKADDVFMESIEPFDYSGLKPFDMAYLTGYLADKYDVPPERGEERIRQRVDKTMNQELQASLLGYATVVPASRKLHIRSSGAKYVLLPVWVLNTNYRGKRYTFAMNGQTGAIAGTFPACPRRTAAWFGGIFAGLTVLGTLLRLIF